MEPEEELDDARGKKMKGVGLIGVCLILSLCSIVFIRGDDPSIRLTSSESKENSAIGRKRLRSDIRLSKHQKHQDASKPPSESPLKKTVESTLTEVLTFTWDNGLVPYKIDHSYSNQSRQLIQGSIADFVARVNRNITKPSCIRFEELGGNVTNLPVNYVNFFPGERCDSTVGRPFHPANHNVSIGLDCMTHGIIQHELLHILGFWHEQSRVDRDKYIKIMWDNVLDDAKENFRPYSDPVDDHLGLPYDYASIMHYPSNAFSRNGNDTIIPIYGPKEMIGQRDHPTSLDLIKVRLRYQCMNHQNESNYRALLTYPIPLSADNNAPLPG